MNLSFIFSVFLLIGLGVAVILLFAEALGGVGGLLGQINPKREKISELFSVQTYDRDTELFYLDKPSLGFGFLCWPLSGGDQRVFDRLNGLMNLHWPTGAILQFSLWTSPDLATERLLVPRGNGIPEILRRMRQERAQFLRQAGQQPLDGGFPLRDIQILVTVRLPIAGNFAQDSEVEAAKHLKQATHEALKTCGFMSRTLTDQDYLRFMETLLNWHNNAWWRNEPFSEYDPQRPLSEQLVDYSTRMQINKDDVRLGTKIVKMLSPKLLPEETYYGIADHFLSDPLTGSRGIREPALISAAVYFPDTEARRGRLENIRRWVTKQCFGPLVRMNDKLAKKKASYDVLFESLDKGDRLVQIRLNAMLFCDDEDRASRAVASLQSYWREINLKMMEDQYICGPLFLNCLPFGAEPEVVKELQRYRTMTTRQAMVFLPLFADWKGTPTPVMQFVGRDGQLMTFDLFDSSSNYNAVIAAQSGSGKSFLTNEFITQYLSTGGRVWVLDIGRSYVKLAEAMNGTFMVFDSKSKICLNPFPLIRESSEEDDRLDEKNMLKEMLATMMAPGEPYLDNYQNSQLERILWEMWQKHSRNLSIDLLAEAFQAEKDPRLKDMGAQLFSFTSRGEYGRYFNGPNTVNFQGDFIVLELEELRGHKHLQKVVLMQLIYQIQQAMFLGDRNRKKLVIVDEGWDLLTQGQTSKFIVAGFRRFRKYNGAAIVVTQSINDLYDSPGGEAIAENSAVKILLGQTDEAIERLEETKRLDIGEYGYALLKTLHTIPKKYSELAIKTENGMGVGRLYVEPYKKLLYSTMASEIHAIKDLQESRGMDVMEAIQTLMRQGEMAQLEVGL